jgi:hypothetical protein
MIPFFSVIKTHLPTHTSRTISLTQPVCALLGLDHFPYFWLKGLKLRLNKERRHPMGIPKPLTKEQAPGELHKIYDKMQEDVGRMPNVFGVVARFPAALKALIQFYDTVLSKGKIEAKYKELAYLKTSIINECQY